MGMASGFRLPPSAWKKKTAAWLVVSAMLAACGQKGPLYLPEKPGEIVTRPAPPAQPAPTGTPPDERDDDETTDPPQ
jgi:predicted small lipoprotein YifL